MKTMLRKKKLIVTIASLLLLTFLIPASSQAAGVILVPAAGLAIWGVTVVATGIAALFEKDDEQIAGESDPMTPAADKSDPGSTSTPVALTLQPNEG